MSAILPALLSALLYGTGDFCGGVGSRREGNALPVVLLSHLIGFLQAVLVVAFLPGSFSVHSLAAGIAAGVAGGLAVPLFYRALSTGQMSVVAPLTALTSAGIPVVVGLSTGDPVGLGALAGIVIAAASIFLIGYTPGARSSRPPNKVLGLALGSGVGFGVFFVLLHGAGSDAGMWPLLGARLGSFPTLLVISLGRRQHLLPSRTALGSTLVAGTCDMWANLLFVLACRYGSLSVVAVLTGMYPAVTVLLARQLLNERVHRIQMVALGLGAVAVALTALG